MSFHVAEGGGTRQARASAEKTVAAAREPVAFTTRRSRGLRGFRSGRWKAHPERVTGICVGRHAWLEHLGIGSHHPRTVIPWNAVVRIEGNRIIVNDEAAR